jgi:lantibiotic modifying enzyme
MKVKELEPLLVKVSMINPDQSLPFEDFYLSFVQGGRYELHNLLSTGQLERLTEEAYVSLERNLLERLVGLSKEVFLSEFDRFRSEEILLTQSSDRILYDRFISSLSGGKTVLLQKYPILERLIDTVINTWMEYIVEFLTRLDADILELAKTFANGSDLGKVEGSNLKRDT